MFSFLLGHFKVRKHCPNHLKRESRTIPRRIRCCSIQNTSLWLKLANTSRFKPHVRGIGGNRFQEELRAWIFELSWNKDREEFKISEVE